MIKTRYMAICSILIILIFTTIAPVSASSLTNGPYGAENFTYENYIDIVTNAGDNLDAVFYLDVKTWDEIVSLTHKLEDEIILVDATGAYTVNWEVLKFLIERVTREPDPYAAHMAEQMKELDKWYEWYSSLPYSEQMRILKEDSAIHEEMRKAQEAKAAQQAAILAAKPITLKVNGRVIKTDSPPVVENGRTLAPVRAIVESLGYLAVWNSTTKTVGVLDINSEHLIIEMTIGSKIAHVSVGSSKNYNFDDRTLDAPPKLINGRTMVPVRFIAETLGCKVEWDQATKTVNITKHSG